MNFIKLIRPKHYIKNLLIFLPLIFSGKLLDKNNFITTLIGFVVFCLIASVIYIINDINDKENDSKHETKCKRPIASGKVSIPQAIILLIILLIVAITIIELNKLTLYSILLLLAYFIFNLGYSFGLKNIPLLDIVILVSGFLIRVLFGASLLSIEVSNWLYLTIISISFYLGLGKRRGEFIANKDKTRKVLKYYNKDFLDKNMYMFLSMTIIFYSLWATDLNLVNRNTKLLIWTIPLVIIICMKYSMDIENKSDGDPVEVIFKDKVIFLLGISLATLLFLILYV